MSKRGVFLILIIFGSFRAFALEASNLINFGTNERIQATVLSPERADELFRKIALSKEISFKVNFSFCNARAHKMAQILENEGVISAKVFISGNLRALTKYDADGFVEWGWHTATAIDVRLNNKDIVMVIDPALFSRPVTVEEWSKAMTSLPGTSKDKLYFTNRFDYLPVDHNWIKDPSAPIFRRHSWWTLDNREMEKELKIGLEIEGSERQYPDNKGRRYLTKEQKEEKRGEKPIDSEGVK